MKKLIVIILFSLPFFSQAQKSKNIPEALYSCWSGSIEEDNLKSNERTYRLCNYPFPPSMFRPTVKFKRDGTCEVLHVGPTDIHYYAACNWTYDKRKKRVTVIDKDGKLEMKFKIRSIDKHVLKIVSEM